MKSIEQLRIGIDLDNTLILYDRVFLEAGRALGLLPGQFEGGKVAVKEYLRGRDPTQEAWQELQGQVYGRWLHRATLMPGASRFLIRCRLEGIPVEIVSHKTDYGHFDRTKTPLRQVALEWLEQNEFFDSDRFGLSFENIHFEDTRSEKAETIGRLKLTHFVDDLQEMFEESNFPLTVKKILFAPGKGTTTVAQLGAVTKCATWQQVSSVVFGKAEDARNEKASLDLARFLTGNSSIINCSLINRGGNSLVYKLDDERGKAYAMKKYPSSLDDTRDRLGAETKAISFLRANGILNVPRLIREDSALNIAIFEWLEGEIVYFPNEIQLNEMARFIMQVHELRTSAAAIDLPLASEACLSGAELFKQLVKRRQKLREVEPSYLMLDKHLELVFDPLCDEVKNRAELLWPAPLHFDSELPIQYRTLSPSDFGFHNALISSDNQISIIDFEYFGWDDPVKLISDFCWHPGMQLTEQLRKLWLAKTSGLFCDDKTFDSRLVALYPAYGLRWALIVLNKFLKKISVEDHEVSLTTVEKQLNKSAQLCSTVRCYLNEN